MKIVRIRPYHFAPDKGWCVYVIDSRYSRYEINNVPIGKGAAYYGTTIPKAIAAWKRAHRESLYLEKCAKEFIE